MMQSNIALKLKLGSPDIFLRPNVNTFRVLDFLKARQVIEVDGRREGRAEARVERADRGFLAPLMLSRCWG